MPARRRIVTAGVIAATAALGGVAGAAAVVAFDDPGTTVVREVTVAQESQTAAASTSAVSSVYKKTFKGVVEITVTTQSDGSGFGAPGSGESQAQGSGFVLDRQGHVVTNQHVVDGASEISVRFWNGSTYSATVVGTDASTDLAVLDVDAPSSILHPLTLGSSSGLTVGDGVIAIGSPFGLEGTVTTGIVSALHRQIEAPNGFSINDAIQTDAAINHGNSGGPLLDALGRVVGVNAQIESESGGNDGVGFAVPSDTIRPIAAQLISGGSVSHAYLGVSVATITANAAGRLDLTPGVAVTAVRTDTPAADAGLVAATSTETANGEEVPTGGDVVTAIDGQKVETADELRAKIDAKQPGDTLELTVARDGKTRTVTVKLAERPS